MVKLLAPHLWSKEQPQLRRRVVLSLGLLMGGKLLNVQVPFLFKDAVDALNQAAPLTNDVGIGGVAGAMLIGCAPRQTLLSRAR